MYTDKLSQLIKELEERCAFLNGCCNDKPEGRISFVNERGKARIKYVTIQNGKRVRKNIGSSDKLVSQMLKADRMESEALSLQSALKSLNFAYSKLEGTDYSSVYKNLVLKYPKAEASVILAAMSDLPTELSEYMSEPYERSDYMPEQLTQPTNWGIKVRSKNEALIGNSLLAAGIPFRYEKVLHLQDGILIPDFTIEETYNGTFFWEHCGLMSNEDYYKNWKKKEEKYHRNGIVPWKNLIVTYDRNDGSIDMEEVQFIIRNRLRK